MKRLGLFLAGLLLGLSAKAQSPVQVEYFEAEPYLNALLNYQQIGNYGIAVSGDFSNVKKVLVTRYECNGGEFVSEEMPNLWIPVSDTIQFYVFAPTEGTEEARLGIMAKDGGTNMHHSVFRNSSFYHILMETYSDKEYLNDEEIPIIGYTSGIARQYNVNGMILEGFDYCGLRDAHTHPAEWHEKHGVDGYTYYTVRFEF